MYERLKTWKWALTAMAAFVLVPAFVAPLLAQSRDAKEFGRAAMPCLCCLDIQIPDIGPWGLLFCVLALAALVAVGAWCESINQKAEAKKKQEQDAAAEKVKAETTEKYGWHVGKTVWFTNEGVQEYGVVMEQVDDTLHINRLNSAGQTERITRKVSELVA